MVHEDIRDDIFSSFIEIVATRKVLIIIGMLSVIVTTAIGTYFMPSKYIASTKIMVTPPVVPKGDMQYFSDLGSGPAFISNQRELIRSKRIYEQVVTDLRLHTLVGPPSIIQRAKKTYFKIEIYPFEEAIDALYSNTSVDIIKGTNIIQITAHADSAMQASEIANTIALTYTNYINTLLSGKAKNVYNFLEAELQSAHGKFGVAQNNLKLLNEQVSPMTIATDISDSRKKLGEFEVQYERIQEEIQNIENNNSSESSDISSKLNDDDRQVSTEANPRILQLENDLKQSRNALSIALGKNTDIHPDVRRLRDKVKKLEEELSREQEEFARKPKTVIAKSKHPNPNPKQGLTDIKSRRERLLGQQEKISRQIQNQRSQLRKLTMNAGELAKLTQEVSATEKEYMMLRERFENARVLKGNETEKEPTIKIVDPARPPGYPDSKKKLILFAVGFMASILFSLGLAFIAEYVDDSFRNRDDAQKYLELPILGTIPFISKELRIGRKVF